MRALLEEHRKRGNLYPLIGGHRGCICDFAENTIPAMEEGLNNGAAYLEIDIQLTKDKVPIVFHDVETSDKCSFPGLVHEHTLSEFKSCVEINTFEEVMRWGKANNVYFALELKGITAFTQEPNFELLGLMDEIVKQAGMLGNVEAFGVDYSVLKRLKEIDPEFEIGLIVPFVPADPVALMRDMQAMIFLSYIFNQTPSSIKKLQDAGYYVSGAILKDSRLVDYAIKTEVDMFEHDYPAQVYKPWRD